MNLVDVLFLDLYKSIRGNWSGGIGNRARAMNDLLPKTSLPSSVKEFFITHLKNMGEAWVSYLSGNGDFDGRDWSRSAEISYDDLEEIKEWFDKGYYDSHSIYEESVTRFQEVFPAFDSNNYMGNFFYPQLDGRNPKVRDADTHSDETEKITRSAVMDFLAGKLAVSRDEEQEEL